MGEMDTKKNRQNRFLDIGNSYLKNLRAQQMFIRLLLLRTHCQCFVENALTNGTIIFQLDADP